MTEIFTTYPTFAFALLTGLFIAIAAIATTGTTDQFGNVPYNRR